MKEIKILLSLMDRKARRRIGLLVVLVCLSGPAEVLGLGAIVAFLGVVAEPESVNQNRYLSFLYSWADFENLVDFVTVAGVSMVSLVTLSNLLLALVNYFSLRLTWGQHRKQSVRLMGLYLERDYLWYLSRNTSELSKSVLNEVQEVINGILKPGIGLASNLFRVLAIGLFLFYVNPRVASLAVLIGGGGFSFLVWLTHARLVALGASRLSALRSMYKLAGEMFSGVKEVKIFGGEGYLLSRFDDVVNKYRESQISRGLLAEMPKYFVQTVSLVGIAVLAVYLFRSGYRDQEVFTTLALFAVGGYRMMGACHRTFASYTSIRFGSAALSHLSKELSYEPSCVTGQQSIDFLNSVNFESVGFRYPGQDEDVLRDISLALKRHSKTAFVGSTGSGKTTLINLLLGLLSPTLGRILIDGRELDSSCLRAWQRRIGYVPQDVFLLDDSILCNIAFAIPEGSVDRDAAIRAAKVAQLHDFIETELVRGYDTVIGERGARLSGGQRQRLGIARALYHDPEILILDEATSALDGKTEQLVMDGIESSSVKRTLIIIAHRLQTIRHCDTVHVLQGGVVIASGSYDDLESGNEAFQALLGSSEESGEA